MTTEREDRPLIEDRRGDEPRRRHWRPAAKRRLAGIFPSIGSVDVNTGCVALTFDDGPDRDVTPRALDALASLDAKATFFLLTSSAEAAPGLVQRIVVEGHEVGLHGASHLSLLEASTAQVIRCIAGGRHRLEQVAGAPVRLFRPPFGRLDLRSYLVARASLMQVIAWSVQVDDWLDNRPDLVIDRLRAELKAGAIVLLHDGMMLDPRQGDAGPAYDRGDAVVGLVGVLGEQDLRGVTVSKLIDLGSPVRFPWFT